VAAAVTSARLDRSTVIAVIAAALIWSLYNVGFATIFSFGPSMLVERGWSITAAGSAISIVLWLTVFSVASGGFLADRFGRPEFIIVAGCIVFAGLMITLAHSDAVIAITVALGLICGLPAGSIMGLPTRVLPPATRAIGIGLFFTVYYAGMMLGPVLGGACAKWAGSATAALDFGAAMILVCPAILWGFDRIAAAVPKTA
jgi:MFS family permease